MKKKIKLRMTDYLVESFVFSNSVELNRRLNESEFERDRFFRKYSIFNARIRSLEAIRNDVNEGDYNEKSREQSS